MKAQEIEIESETLNSSTRIGATVLSKKAEGTLRPLRNILLSEGIRTRTSDSMNETNTPKLNHLLDISAQYVYIHMFFRIFLAVLSYRGDLTLFTTPGCPSFVSLASASRSVPDSPGDRFAAARAI